MVLLFSFVFLNIPRMDFFLCSVLFLFAFITMFYLDDPALLVRLLRVYLAGSALLWHSGSSWASRRPWMVPCHIRADWLTLAFILLYCGYVSRLVRHRPRLRKRYRTGPDRIVIVAPFTIVFGFQILSAGSHAH